MNARQMQPLFEIAQMPVLKRKAASACGPVVFPIVPLSKIENVLESQWMSAAAPYGSIQIGDACPKFSP